MSVIVVKRPHRNWWGGSGSPLEISPDNRDQTSHTMNPFTRATAAWHLVGLASEFPSIDDDNRIVPRCKAFNIPKTNGAIEPVEDIDLPGELKDQVLVFKYKGKYHAIDHVS